MTEFLVGVVIALLPGVPVAVWLTRPRRYSAVVALGVAEAVAVLLLTVLDQHPPRPADIQPAVIVRPPTAPACGRTCAAGSGSAEDWSAPAPAASHTVVPAAPSPPRQARRQAGPSAPPLADGPAAPHQGVVA